MENNLVVACFSNTHDAHAAIAWAKDHNQDFDYYSPFPEHHMEDEYFRDKKRSPVRRVTLTGALTGCLGAFLFTSWMSIDYPLRVSAKPLLSYPSFIIIAFECTILLGAIFTMLALLTFCGIPSIFKAPGYRPEFTEGHFGIVVRTEDTDKIKAELEKLGAEKVEVEYAR